MADALAAGKQAVSELLRLQMDVTLHLFKPFHAIARRALQLQRLDLALFLVETQGVLHVAAVGREHARQRHGIFHGQLGAGTDAEVRGVGGIADQHDVFVKPFFAQHAVELEPDGGPAQVPGIGNQRIAFQPFRKELLAERNRLFAAPSCQSRRPASSFPASQR